MAVSLTKNQGGYRTLRKMMRMRAGPAVRPTPGPFVLPARIVLLIAGLVAVALAAFDVLHELHAAQVDRVYGSIALVLAAISLAAVIAAFFGLRLAIFFAGAMGFIEFALVASGHFESGALGRFVKKEGLPLATVDMALVLTCALVVISAGVAWTNPRGRNRNLDLLPLLAAATVGSILVILQATDDFHRTDFGTANPEDGAFSAAFLATFWLVGGLWIAHARRLGALVIIVATFGVWYSFVTLHLIKGVTVSQIASRSGVVWAFAAAAAAIIAAACFLLSVGLLAWSFVPGKRSAAEAAAQRARRGA